MTRNAIFELDSIIQFAEPRTREALKAWFARNIREARVDIRLTDPREFEVDRTFRIKAAKFKLAELIVEEVVMFPVFKNFQFGRLAQIGAHYFVGDKK